MIYVAVIRDGTKEVSSLRSEPRRLRVTVHVGRTLRLYNPHRAEMLTVHGKSVLDGYIKKSKDVHWILFPSKRHFGLPLTRRREVDERIEIVLSDAQYFKDVLIERCPSEVEETLRCA